VALPSSRIVIAELTDVIPPKPASFEEVQTKVHDAVLQIRLRAAEQKHAQEVIEKAKSMNGDIEKAAKSLGLEAKLSDPVNFSGTIDGLGSTAFLANVIKQPAGTFFGPFPVTDGSVVGKVVEHVLPDPAKLAAERDSIRDEIKNDRLRDRNALFEAGLRETLTKQGKIKIYKEVVDRLVNDFSTNRG
jgi:peptidyl-prolyl cis-trans isomerase D